MKAKLAIAAVPVDKGYSFAGNKNPGTWIVSIQISDAKVYEKLKSRGKSVGLKWAKWNSDGTINSSGDITEKAWESGINVGLLIR